MRLVWSDGEEWGPDGPGLWNEKCRVIKPYISKEEAEERARNPYWGLTLAEVEENLLDCARIEAEDIAELGHASDFTVEMREFFLAAKRAFTSGG